MTKEQNFVDLINELERNDKTFRFLIPVLTNCFTIALLRGKEYNGNGSNLMDQIFYDGDESAFHNAFRPWNRIKEAKDRYRDNIPDDKIKDKIIDQINYLIDWYCCRMERKHEMDSNGTTTTPEILLHADN